MATVGLKLNRVQAQIAKDMDKIEQVQTLSGAFVIEHLKRIPSEQVDSVFPVLQLLALYLNCICVCSFLTQSKRHSPSLI